MSASITDGTTTIAPQLVIDYATDQSSRNVVHDILGRSDPDISLAPAGLRKGTLKLLFGSAVDAEAARAFHSKVNRFVYTDTDVASVSMSYVLDPSGTMTTTEDYPRWTLDVPYQEVSS